MLLTVRDVAGMLNVSPTCVYSLIERRKLAHIRIGRGRGTIRIRQDDLRAYLSTQEVEPEKRPTRTNRIKLRHLQLPPHSR